MKILGDQKLSMIWNKNSSYHSGRWTENYKLKEMAEHKVPKNSFSFETEISTTVLPFTQLGFLVFKGSIIIP